MEKGGEVLIETEKWLKARMKHLKLKKKKCSLLDWQNYNVVIIQLGFTLCALDKYNLMDSSIISVV